MVPGVGWFVPTGGLYVWLWLPLAISAGPDGPLFDLAVREGVLYVPGEYCYPDTGGTGADQHAPVELRGPVAGEDRGGNRRVGASGVSCE